MVRASISGDGVDPLVRLHGKGNAAVYKQLVRDHVKTSQNKSIFTNNKISKTA